MSFMNYLIFRVTKVAMKLYCLMGMRIAVEGLQHIPRRSGAILVANHRSMVDGPLLYSLMDRMIYSFIKADYFDHPWMRWYLRGGGGIPVKSGAFRLSTLKEAHRVLQRGDMLLIFPEGQINEGHGLLPFNPTFMKLAMTYEVPVVSVTIVGTDRALPDAQWRWIPRPARVKIVVNEAVYYSRLGKPKWHVDASAEEVRLAILRTWWTYERDRFPETRMVSQRMVPSDKAILGDRVHGGG
jgi:1-acyl-sn-glycerol-3-phosphate acyltransferase